MRLGLELRLILLGTLFRVLLCAVEVIYNLSLLQEVTSDRQSLEEKLKISSDHQSQLELRCSHLEESLTAAANEKHSLEAALKTLDTVDKYLK